MLLYSLLYLSGYEKITLDEIKRFRELGSHCEGHPEFDPTCGIEITTGPLGQGIANAAGMAVAEAFLYKWLGRISSIITPTRWSATAACRRASGRRSFRSPGTSASASSSFLWDDNRMTDDGAIESR